MTPPPWLIRDLKARTAARDLCEAEIRAAREKLAAAWPESANRYLDALAEVHGLDERAPEPAPKAKRTRAPKPKPEDLTTPVPLDPGDVERFLKLRIPDLAREKLEPAHIRQLLAAEEGSIDARPAYVAHLRGRL